MLSKYLDELENSSKLIFVTGGTKSGKSEFAEFLLKNFCNVTYVALSHKRQDDDNWQQKIIMHRKRRSKSWRLIETIDLLTVLKSEHGPLLIDSIGGFIMENIELENKLWLMKMDLLIKNLKNRKSLTVIVGEQVGWSLVSEYKIGNIYIERMGELQKMITKISKDNWLALNGRVIKIDDISLEIPS